MHAVQALGAYEKAEEVSNVVNDPAFPQTAVFGETAAQQYVKQQERRDIDQQRTLLENLLEHELAVQHRVQGGRDSVDDLRNLLITSARFGEVFHEELEVTILKRS